MNPTRSSIMSQPDLWADPTIRRAYLGQQVNDSALCLILGAGISIPLGLPNWEQLLARLYRGIESQRPTDIDLKRQAEYFKSEFCSCDDSVFNRRVKDALYDGYRTDFEVLRRNDTLGAIAALVMSSVRGRASTVINFNFDDLLEIFLEYHGFVVNAVGEERYWTRACDVEVLHPHGYLPSSINSRREMSRRIVLDQRDYSRVMGDESQPWRQRILTAMRTKTSLFIGTSGLDDNMDSLISNTHETHAMIDSSTAYWGAWLTVGAELHRQKAWKDRGVFPLVLQDYSEIPSELFAIAQQASVERQSR